MAELKYWLWLRSLRGLGNSACLRLLQYFGSPERVYYAEGEDYAQVEKITRAQIEALADKRLDRAEEILADCTRLGLHILTCSDAAYPERLRAIPDAPCLLYYKGDRPDFDSEPAVALIGTRKATPYGVRIGERLGYELTKGGAYVVSGLAAGGDAAGHRGALMAGGPTAAVLGGGIDVIYPAENRPLFSDIAASGVLISGRLAQRHHEHCASRPGAGSGCVRCAGAGGRPIQPGLQPYDPGGRRRGDLRMGSAARIAAAFSREDRCKALFAAAHCGPQAGGANGRVWEGAAPAGEKIRAAV